MMYFRSQSILSTAVVTVALITVSLLPCTASQAESKRIEVYALSQNYVDTRTGDTLGQIATRLLPNNPLMQQKLMDDILRLNPDAFIERNPNRLLANIRLWLPNHLSKADSRPASNDVTVETFSWGNIKKPR